MRSPSFRVAFRSPGFPRSGIRGPPEIPSCSLELRGTLSSPPGWTSRVFFDTEPYSRVSGGAQNACRSGSSPSSGVGSE
eukprot:12041580-Alexandrium_andersonii.AAC.1